MVDSNRSQRVWWSVKTVLTFVTAGVNQQMRFACVPLSLFAQKCVMERALSVSSDESVAPGEANMWHWLFELANHYELRGALLEILEWTSAARQSATCMCAVMVAPMPKVSVEKFTFALVRVMSKRLVAVHEVEAGLA